MSVDKNLFKLEDGGSFRPDYYEEYKGYQFAISLSYHGTRDAAVVFPEGVNEILDLSQDDVIKICHDFIDAVINHEDCSAKHGTLLNTIKSAKNKAWRTRK